MFEPGKIIDLRYYDDQHHVKSIMCEVIFRNDQGIVVNVNSRTEQYFPWTSVQRLIVDA